MQFSKSPLNSDVFNDNAMTLLVEKRFAAHARGPAYLLNPSVNSQASQVLNGICKRPELQPLLHNISFHVTEELGTPFRIGAAGKIVLNKEILDNSSLAAFHIRHALELIAWHRHSHGPPDLLTMLMATQVVSRIREKFPVDLKLRYFFEMPSIAGIAQGLEALSWNLEGSQVEGEAETASQEKGII